MSNEDYREKIEEHRQSIEIAENQNSRMSRSRRTVKKKNRKNPLLNILLFILLGIPSTLLIYVFFFYNPSETELAELEENGSIVEVQRNQTVSASGKEKEEPKIEESDEDNAAPDAAEMEKQKAAKAAQQAEIEAAKKAEQEKQAQQEQQVQQEPAMQQQEQERKADQAASTKTHTVQPNENLFRIALKYYDDASGVDKIKAANNLSSNSISVGQTLIIP